MHNRLLTTNTMPQTETKFFGVVPFDDNAELRFPGGLPGFEEHDRFLALNRPGMEPLVFLQSLIDPALCFVTLPVLSVETGYRLAASPEDLASLGFEPDRMPEIGREAMCLAVLTLVPGGNPTANLMSPVLVNVSLRRGMQVIQTETEYSHRHSLDNLPERQ